MAGVMPSESWGPYRWLWTHLVLARDPETGAPTPYTHGVRRRTVVWLPLFVVAIAWLVWSARAQWWRVLLGFVLGFLAGHFWW